MPSPRASARPWAAWCDALVRSYRPDVSRRQISSAAISAALAELDADRRPESAVLRDAVRALLAALAEQAPGRSVEMRVPPYGAIQCVEGPRHTRGTPPNVVETDPITFVLLATGRLDWAKSIQKGLVRASGSRADLSEHLPCWAPPVADAP